VSLLLLSLSPSLFVSFLFFLFPSIEVRFKEKIDWKENEKIIQFLEKALLAKYIFIEHQNIGKMEMENKLNDFFHE